MNIVVFNTFESLEQELQADDIELVKVPRFRYQTVPEGEAFQVWVVFTALLKSTIDKDDEPYLVELLIYTGDYQEHVNQKLETTKGKDHAEQLITRYKEICKICFGTPPREGKLERY